MGEKVEKKTGEKVGKSLGEINKLNLCHQIYLSALAPDPYYAGDFHKIRNEVRLEVTARHGINSGKSAVVVWKNLP